MEPEGLFDFYPGNLEILSMERKELSTTGNTFPVIAIRKNA